LGTETISPCVYSWSLKAERQFESNIELELKKVVLGMTLAHGFPKITDAYS
jgi:hypothetical protein